MVPSLTKLKWKWIYEQTKKQIPVCRTGTRAHFYTPFGVVRYVRNLALPLGELSAQPTEREKHDHTKGQ